MAAPKSKSKQNNRGRDDSFEAVAARLGCDPDMDKFRAKMKKIAKAKPKTAK